MGNCNFKAETEKDNVQAQNKTSFHFMYVIGRGGFGKVWKVEMRKQKELFAMKEMAKARIISKRSVNSVMNEKKFLSQLNHPFLVNMHSAFQDRDNLYLVIDLMTGGDMRYHIGKHRRFTEEQTKFFIACMILCLEFLHANCILHRDIKPENLVFDEDGYLRITDLGIARVWNPDNGKDTSGTPGYMAPEVMCRQPHTVSVDYFAAGVIGFECMYGKRPYQGKDRKEIRDHILSKQVQIRKNEIPPGWSLAAADFINKLILRKPTNRLGQNGPQDLKDHIWFKGYDWDALLKKKIPAPFIPPKEDNFDAKYTNSDWKDANTEQMQQNQALLKRPSVQKLFMGYYHDETMATSNGKKDQTGLASTMLSTMATKTATAKNTSETLQNEVQRTNSQQIQKRNQFANSQNGYAVAQNQNMGEISSGRNLVVSGTLASSNKTSMANQNTGQHASSYHGYSNSMQAPSMRQNNSTAKSSQDQLMASLMQQQAFNQSTPSTKPIYGQNDSASSLHRLPNSQSNQKQQVVSTNIIQQLQKQQGHIKSHKNKQGEDLSRI